MGRYVLLIYDDESAGATMTPEDGKAMMDAYFAYSNEVEAAGVFRSGDALMPTATATSVQVRGGQTLTTDGPFAETKEQLGGYYLVETDTKEEALAWAAKIPGAKTGTIEVRPLMEFPEQG